jgi:hypothetical protein
MQLDELNDTELWELARMELSAAWRRPIRLRRSLPREAVIQLIESGAPPHLPDVLLESREKLEQWIVRNWEMVNSQLPCSGPDRGKCTRYACPEGRHLSCYSAAAIHMRRGL